MFFDVKIFNPLTKSCPNEVKEAYKYHETLKKLKYEQRILDVENSSFNPLVFACSGGAGPSASKVMSRHALKINEKGQDSYSDAIRYIRTQISFALLRSSVLCLRGSRSIRRQTEESSVSAMVEEGRLSWPTSTILIWWFLRCIYSRCFLKLWYDALNYKSLLHLTFLVLVSFRGPLLTLYGGSAACSDLAPCLSFSDCPCFNSG